MTGKGSVFLRDGEIVVKVKKFKELEKAAAAGGENESTKVKKLRGKVKDGEEQYGKAVTYIKALQKQITDAGGTPVLPSPQ